MYESKKNQTGIEMAQNTMPDLVFMDIQLPEMGWGLGNTFMINRGPDLKTIPVIIVTSNAMNGGKKRYHMNAGCVEFIMGPLKPAVFSKDIIRIILGRLLFDYMG